MKKKGYVKKGLTLLTTTFLITLMIFGNLALAAESSIKKMDVVLKPEYDREKTVLIMYSGELSKANSKIITYLPKELIEDSTLYFCSLDENKQHYCQPREKEVEGNLYKFTNIMPYSDFNVEGYAKLIKDDNGKKTFNYVFKAGQDIDELNIHIAEAKNSTNFKVSPSGQSNAKDSENLENAIYSFKNVKAGKKYKFNVSYTKKGWEKGFENRTMGGEATPANTNNSSGVSTLAIISAILGALIVAGGLLFAFSKKNQGGGSNYTPVAPKGKSRFCPNCGTRLASNKTKFCSNCGFKLK